jgi:hypothetical protein
LGPAAAALDGAAGKFHSTSVLLSAFEAAERAKQDARAAITTILLASAATEAFIHELAAHIDRCHKARDWTPGAITPGLVAAGAAIVGTRERVVDRYVAAAAALGQPFDAGSRMLKDAGRLMGLQQCIVGCVPEQRAEALTDELTTRGIAKARHRDQLPWFRRLQTPSAAEWASRGACALIVATLDLIPATTIEPVRAVQALYRGLQAGIESGDARNLDEVNPVYTG